MAQEIQQGHKLTTADGRHSGLSSAVLAVSLLAARAVLAAVPAPGELVTLQALHQQWIQDQLWCGQGDVHITYQDISLRCDEIEVDLATMHLHAEGNVTLDQADARMACNRMEFDLRRKIGTFYQVQAFFPPTFNFRGQEMEKLDETHYRLHRGLFTSCSLSDTAPPWSFEVRDAIVELEGYGHFRDVSLKVRGVPVFFTPRLLWPVKRDRAAGFLVPSFGNESTRGAYIGDAFFWPISRSLDTTFFLALYSKGFLGYEQEVRWAPTEQASGNVSTSFVYDPDTKRWEWEAQGKHNQLFPGGWSLHSELHDVSDINYFQQFNPSFDASALRTLDSYATLSRTWGPQALNFRVDHQRTFFTDPISGATSEIDLDRMGEVEYRLRSTRIGLTALYVSAVASADEFRIDRSATLRGTYSRLDAFPTVSLLTPGFAWLNVTPTFGARDTYYTGRYSPDGQSLLSEPLSRQYGTAGLSLVGPSFSRVWTKANGDKVKHLIEPRIDYTYVSNPGSFSAGTSGVSPIPIFDEKDSVLASNQVQWTLANSLFVRSGSAGSREVARLEISQPYSFSDPLTPARSFIDPVTSGQVSYPESFKGPLSLWLRALPVPSANVDARAYLDPVTHALQSTSLSGGFNQGTNGFNVTWFSSYDPISGNVTSSQTRLFLGLSPGAARWRVESQFAYDIHLRSLLEQRYVFRWRGSCWTALVELRDYRGPLYPARNYRVAIDLTGLGTFLDIHGALDSFVH